MFLLANGYTLLRKPPPPFPMHEKPKQLLFLKKFFHEDEIFLYG